ncbi:phosphatase PAP2 family protein [Lactobacillus xylocopicola]|uniref:Phosphatase PAP2 family protein n=1 Tax=Lactobacillus xylocopicola TaxID=2976676 RepID=A0ABN6SK64_9LACO|nr:phosphatase PAP2 family protein [Lactobacillus xylocopicola]BDR60780.1 phosphatase PAP2 family protein [Lactobacillus xylocopicola]
MDTTYYHYKRDTIVPATIFTLLYATWAILVSSGSQLIRNFDKTVINAICNHNAASVKFTTAFTNLGNTSVIVVETIIICVVLAFCRKYAFAFFTAGTMITANGYNWLIKHAVERQRPLTHHLVDAHGYSFPSGHSVGSAALFGVLIVLTILLVRNWTVRSLLCFIWALFPLLIGYTRIFSHVHYPSDVVGGFLGGIAFVLIGYTFLFHYYLEE